MVRSCLSNARFANINQLYNDYLKNPAKFGDAVPSELAEVDTEASYTHPAIAKLFSKLAKEDYERKVEPSLLLPKLLGNSYTGSLYTGLLSLVANKSNEELVAYYNCALLAYQNQIDKRLLMFSYGSGLAATQFSIKVAQQSEQLNQIRDMANILSRVNDRIQVDPAEFVEVCRLMTWDLKLTLPCEQVLQLREKSHSAVNYVPSTPIDNLAPGTYYLEHIDERKRRFYSRV